MKTMLLTLLETWRVLPRREVATSITIGIILRKRMTLTSLNVFIAILFTNIDEVYMLNISDSILANASTFMHSQNSLFNLLCRLCLGSIPQSWQNFKLSLQNGFWKLVLLSSVLIILNC